MERGGSVPCRALITGLSWDGSPPGRLPSRGVMGFSFRPADVAAGVNQAVLVDGSPPRGRTTIGAGDEVLFDPGYVAAGTQRTITKTESWTMWATTPALLHAESTGMQWAFTPMEPQRWAWGLEDIAIGRCDCDYQDAYGLLVRIGDASPVTALGLLTPPTTSDLSTVVDDSLTAVPEPGTIALVTIGLAGLGARRRRRQR